MVPIIGSYKLEKNENLDAFYTAAEVPWIARKIMLTTSPTMHISREEKEEENEDNRWLFKTVSFIQTVEQSFKLEEPYEEAMPSGDVFQCVATMEGATKFVIKSHSDDKGDFERDYEFNQEGLVITLKHPTGIEAKRYFRRL